MAVRRAAGVPALVFALGLSAAAALCASGAALAQDNAQPQLSAPEKDAERAARVRIMEEGLARLHKLNPQARQSVEKAAGYAVFDVSAIYAILFVGQQGKGVLVDNGTKKQTFMLSTRAGTGPGFGKQRVYQVFVFKSKGAMEQFVAVGGTGGDVSASVSAGSDGSVRSFNPGIDIYQMPESGMALQSSWGGTVYSVDPQLQ